MGVSSHTVLMIHGGDSNSTVDEFRLRSLCLFLASFFFYYHLPSTYSFFQKHLFGAGSSPRLSVACLRTSSLDIFILYFVTVTYSYLFSALHTSRIHYMPFIICRFRVDTTLIWIPFLVQREGEGRSFFSFLFFSFSFLTFQLSTQQILDYMHSRKNFTSTHI